jgi:Antitoxin VbhA
MTSSSRICGGVPFRTRASDSFAKAEPEGLEPGAEDLALFAEVAAGRLSTDELRQRVLSRYRR